MYEDLIEKKISSEAIFDGVLLHVKRDTVKLPNGKRGDARVDQASGRLVRHPAAAGRPHHPRAPVPLSDRCGDARGAGRQKLDAPDEDPLVCAERELSEETGYTAEHITKLTTIATTVGFSNEKIHLYAAEGLTPGKQHTDEDEFINVVKVPLEEAVAMATDGRIVDAKSVISILMLAAQRDRKINVEVKEIQRSLYV